MNKSQKSIKLGSGKKALYIILIALPIFILLQMSLMSFIGVMGVNYLAVCQLTEQRSQVGMAASKILFQRRMAPAEKLILMKFPRDNMEAAALALEFPEITEIYLFSNDGFKTIFTAAPSAKIHDGIAKTALAVKDTISFINAYWDTTFKTSTGLMEIEGNKYAFTFIRKGGDLRLIVVDPEKLKPLLPEIFHRAESNIHSSFGDYFSRPFPRYGAQLKFYDESGENFCTYGDPKGRGWDDIFDIDLSKLPWRLTVQIFPKQENLIDSAAAAGKIPWPLIIEFIIAVVCIILAVHFSPKLRGFSKTDKS